MEMRLNLLQKACLWVLVNVTTDKGICTSASFYCFMIGTVLKK
jgi:hypothetical protein